MTAEELAFSQWKTQIQLQALELVKLTGTLLSAPGLFELFRTHVQGHVDKRKNGGNMRLIDLGDFRQDFASHGRQMLATKTLERPSNNLKRVKRRGLKRKVRIKK